jgi:hypothetical protein
MSRTTVSGVVVDQQEPGSLEFRTAWIRNLPKTNLESKHSHGGPNVLALYLYYYYYYTVLLALYLYYYYYTVLFIKEKQNMENNCGEGALQKLLTTCVLINLK